MSKDKHKQRDRILHTIFEMNRFGGFAINRSHCRQFHRDSDDRDIARMLKEGIIKRVRTKSHWVSTHRRTSLKINTSER